MCKKVIWGVVVVVVITILGAAYYISKNIAFYEDGVSWSNSNWKTYSNSEYGIEFKYPEDLIVLDRSYKTPGGGVFPSFMIVSPDEEKDNAYVVVSSRTTASTAPDISCDGTYSKCREFGSYIVYTRSTDNRITNLFSGMINSVKFTSPTNTVQSKGSVSNGDVYVNEEYGFSFNYPKNFVELNEAGLNGLLAKFHDTSKVFPNSDVGNWIMVDARSAKGEVSFDNYIKKYPIVSGNNNQPYTFIPRILGKNTFYYTLTERFEGTLSFMYCTINNNAVLCFHSESDGVDWTNQNLDVEADSTHAALRSILSTLKLSVITTPVVKVISPNGGEVYKIKENITIKWSTNKVPPAGSKFVITSPWGFQPYDISATSTQYSYTEKISGYTVFSDIMGDLNSGKYKMKISLYDGIVPRDIYGKTCSDKHQWWCNLEDRFGKVIVEDISDAEFTITN